MVRFLNGAFVVLTVATFALSWAFAFSGMLWPAQAANALTFAQIVYYVGWMRPRRFFRPPPRRCMKPGHICCYLGPVHVPQFVYEVFSGKRSKV